MIHTRVPLAVIYGACLLVIVGSVFGVAHGSGMLVGFDYTPSVAPPGETPYTALARIGGSIFRAYNDPISGSEGGERVRLLRYDKSHVTGTCPNGNTDWIANGHCGYEYAIAAHNMPGRHWQLGNEINLNSQDGALDATTARDFAIWYYVMSHYLRYGDPNAIIIGPSVWNWNGASPTGCIDNHCWGWQCCTHGSDVYQWWTTQHQAVFGVLPLMNAMAVQLYPWFTEAWADPQVGTTYAMADLDAAKAWSAGRWPIVVTEWGQERKAFSGTCTLLPQTDASRSAYTSGMLNGMQARGVIYAIYFGSHEQAPCDGNGRAAWLINGDGSLTVEGLAHRMFSLGK